MTNTEIIIETGKLVAGPNVPPTKVIAREDAVLLAEGTPLQSGDRIFTYRQEMGSCFLTEEKSLFTAEEWLSSQGFSSMRLVTLLDLENQLASVLGNSPKLTAVRAWINGILATFVQDPTPKSDWPAAPFTFEETTQEAFALLST
jgi:hypothetical protein